MNCFVFVWRKDRPQSDKFSTMWKLSILSFGMIPLFLAFEM